VDAPPPDTQPKASAGGASTAPLPPCWIPLTAAPIVYAQTVDSLTWEGDLPHLRSPVLVCAFRGWNDAAAAASTALTAIATSLDAEVIARIDPEEYFDFQSTRPTISMDEGQTRRIDWPENNLLAVEVPGADRDLVLLDGTEPNLRWRTFSETVATAADALGIELVITLGALIAEVSHTLPVPITGLASSQELVDELELERSNYEGPTGIVGVVHDLCRKSGIDSASLWAAVPHYVAAVPNPKAALALLRRLEGLTGIAVEAAELEEETADYEEQIGRAVAANPEIEELVQRIEAEQVDLLSEEGELPSADTLAREFQRFLRQRGKDQS
jgi:proteasome assembly chaperone (PAC2) family protein